MFNCRFCRKEKMKDMLMLRFLGFISIFFVFFPASLKGQVLVRLFASQSPETVVFAVTAGEYLLDGYNSGPEVFGKNDLIVISKFDGRLAVKSRKSDGFVADSVILRARSGNSSFSLRINGQNPIRQYYSGDFACYPDLSTLVLINNCDVESYIAGVVRAEGGIKKPEEYFKTQAIIARTYMYKHLDKHLNDRYNVCDNTHCQAFNGMSTDSLINAASFGTRGQVILDQDSMLINSAFHSNCGGMTASSADVWITDQPYLKSVTDPYCLNSRNATWEKKISTNEWIEYLVKSGYTGKTNDLGLLSFYQNKRWINYKAGSFSMPFEKIRDDLKLRSSFFSVIAAKDSVTFRGKGYGHGVGLCQEGAMEMALQGNNYKQIIAFYYSGVIITDIKNAKFPELQGNR
jgi:stage II sporulation protein D